MDYVFIDGNNLAYRVAYTHRPLMYNDKPVSLLYGFYRNLISLRKQYPDSFFCLVWDGGYDRRKSESEKGVEDGIIASGYKSNRRIASEVPIEVIHMKMQQPELEESLANVRLLQLRVTGCEADDVIYTYVKRNKGKEITVITSDKDYYQMLWDRVIVRDAMRDTNTTRDSFTEEYGFSPDLWVDYGALVGDKSDNIIGVDGWGDKTAREYLSQYGCVENIKKAILAKDKISKREQKLLDSEDRFNLARSLKQMDDIEGLPELEYSRSEYRVETIEDFFTDHGFTTLMKDAWRLV